MSDMLPAAPVAPGLPAGLPRPKLDLPGRSKAAVLLVSLGPERVAQQIRTWMEQE